MCTSVALTENQAVNMLRMCCECVARNLKCCLFGNVKYFYYICCMEKVDVSRLITPYEYSKLIKVCPATVTKRMNAGKVKVINVKGGRLILL